MEVNISSGDPTGFLWSQRSSVFPHCCRNLQGPPEEDCACCFRRHGMPSAVERKRKGRVACSRPWQGDGLGEDLQTVSSLACLAGPQLAKYENNMV